ncbi:hypothetical protein GCM10009559_42790 [Pseudonocardia zijingensis]|uniref:Uncharacterized protein n=1 Tax=Pseudonocardia zijingensis TaxID=153376 RepID=A0ABP4B4L9_9PSEU
MPFRKAIAPPPLPSARRVNWTNAFSSLSPSPVVTVWTSDPPFFSQTSDAVQEPPAWAVQVLTARPPRWVGALWVAAQSPHSIVIPPGAWIAPTPSRLTDPPRPFLFAVTMSTAPTAIGVRYSSGRVLVWFRLVTSRPSAVRPCPMPFQLIFDGLSSLSRPVNVTFGARIVKVSRPNLLPGTLRPVILIRPLPSPRPVFHTPGRPCASTDRTGEPLGPVSAA